MKSYFKIGAPGTGILNYIISNAQDRGRGVISIEGAMLSPQALPQLTEQQDWVVAANKGATTIVFSDVDRCEPEVQAFFADLALRNQVGATANALGDTVEAYFLGDPEKLSPEFAAVFPSAEPKVRMVASRVGSGNLNRLIEEAKAAGKEVISLRTTMMETVDFYYPQVDNGTPDWVRKANERPTLVVLEDVNRASLSVMNVVQHLVYDNDLPSDKGFLGALPAFPNVLDGKMVELLVYATIVDTDAFGSQMDSAFANKFEVLD